MFPEPWSCPPQLTWNPIHQMNVCTVILVALNKLISLLSCYDVLHHLTIGGCSFFNQKQHLNVLIGGVLMKKSAVETCNSPKERYWWDRYSHSESNHIDCQRALLGPMIFPSFMQMMKGLFTAFRERRSQLVTTGASDFLILTWDLLRQMSANCVSPAYYFLLYNNMWQVLTHPSDGHTC